MKDGYQELFKILVKGKDADLSGVRSDEEDFEIAWKNYSFPWIGQPMEGYKILAKHFFLASRKSLREDNEKLCELVNFWAVKAGAAQAKVNKLEGEIDRLRGESPDSEPDLAHP